MLSLYHLFIPWLVVGVTACRWEPIVLTRSTVRSGNDARVDLAFIDPVTDAIEL